MIRYISLDIHITVYGNKQINEDHPMNRHITFIKVMFYLVVALIFLCPNPIQIKRKNYKLQIGVVAKCTVGGAFHRGY